MPLAGCSIVGIHGIAKQQLGRHQLLDPWRRALADGIERATGRRSSLPPLDLAYYGDLFLAAPDGTKAVSDPMDTLLDDLSDEESMELASAVREVAGDEPETDVPTKGYTRAPAFLQSAIRLLDRRFGSLAGALCLGELRQARRYLCEPEIREAANERIAAVATGDCRVLIGHSLGSVAAMDYLLRHPRQRFDLLVTLGSPLGLRFIRDRIAGGPGTTARPQNAARWVNIRDPRDPVASVRLDGLWSGVVEAAVNNQSDAHAVERYLGKRQVGEAIVLALPELLP